jgi:hypothetical protein
MIQVITDFEEMPKEKKYRTSKAQTLLTLRFAPLESRAVTPKQWSTIKKGKIGKNVRENIRKNMREQVRKKQDTRRSTDPGDIVPRLAAAVGQQPNPVADRVVNFVA